MAFTSANGRTQTALADINITPLVDVVLVLLIIFMVTAPVLQSGIEVNVPHTRTVKEITEERLVISIDKSQRVFLGNDPININQIGATLKKKIRDPQHQSIYLRSDEDVPFGAFATVMDAIKQAGISNVSIVTQPMDTSWRPSLIFRHLFRTRPTAPASGLVARIASRIRGVRRALRHVHPRLSRRRLGQRRRRRCHGSDAGERGSLARQSQVQTTNVLATESKGLSKSQPTVQEKEPEAIPIPDKNTKTKTKPVPARPRRSASRNRNHPSRIKFRMARVVRSAGRTP